jgi:type VI secretion system protein ImpH
VAAELCDEITGFDFYQAVRLLQRFLRPLGRAVAAGDPERELVRFRGHLGPKFAASDVRELLAPAADGAFSMTVNFAGIANPAAVGSLPSWYASLARGLEAGTPPAWFDRDPRGGARERRPELRAFFDVFDDRLIALIYRAWQRHFLPAQHEAAADAGAESAPGRARAPFGGWTFAALLAVLGLHTRHQQQRLRLDVRALVRHAGALGRRPATPGALVDVIADYFAVPVEVRPFVAVPTLLPADAQLCLRAAAPFALGRNTILGTRVLLSQSGFRVRLGPLDLATYKSFLPPSQHGAAGGRHRALVDLVRFAAGPEFDFDVQVVLRAGDVPAMQFDRRNQDAMLLGWSTWLGVRPPETDADDTLISASALQGAHG